MLIPQITTIRTEDFPDEKSWIGNLLFPLNQFFLAATNAINGNIALGENVPCQTITFQFTSSGDLDFPKTFKYTLPTKPVEVRVCSATEDADPIMCLASWSYANGQLIIGSILRVDESGVSALEKGAVYNIVLRAQP